MPRDVFKSAILNNSASNIVSYQHPYKLDTDHKNVLFITLLRHITMYDRSVIRFIRQFFVDGAGKCPAPFLSIQFELIRKTNDHLSRGSIFFTNPTREVKKPFFHDYLN